MANPETLLYVGSEEDIIKDVSCSLSMLPLQLVVARSANEAHKYILELAPKLVLTRVSFKGHDKGGLELARYMATDPHMQRVPLAILLKKGEADMIAGEEDLFRGQFYLPVEFPIFTQQIQNLMQSLLVGQQYAMPRSDVPRAEAPRAAPQQAAPPGAPARQPVSPPEPQRAPPAPRAAAQPIPATVFTSRPLQGTAVPPPPDAGLSFKFRQVKDIHTAVLEVLTKSDMFMSCKLDDVPAILAHITHEVCLRFERQSKQ